MKLHIGRMVGACALVVVLAIPASAPAVQRVELPDPGDRSGAPRAIGASYHGTALAIDRSGSVPAFRWTAHGWASATATAGQSFEVQPFAQGWSWAYRGGSWYAIRSANLSAFSCDPAVLRGEQPSYGGTLYRYNNNSTALRTLAAGEAIYPICHDSFPDATSHAEWSMGGYNCGVDCKYVVSYRLVWAHMHGRWAKVYFRPGPGPCCAP